MPYEATVAVDVPRPAILSGGGVDLRVIMGKCNITTYDVTGVEITDITKHFKRGAPTVVCDGVSSLGFIVRWNEIDKCFHAFYPKPATNSTVTIAGAGGAAGANNTIIKTSATTIAVSGTGTAATAPISGQGALVGAEAANGDNIGEFSFIAVGL